MKTRNLYLAAPFIGVAAAVLLGGASSRPANEESLWRHRNLGKAYYETPTSLPQAVTELKQALDLVPDSFRDRLNYGLALLRAGEIKAAIPELEKAQKQNPRVPHTWFNLGVAYKREGRYPDAIREFEHMTQLAPNEPVSHYNLGLLYNLTGREADGLKQFEIAAKLDDKLVAPRYQIYNMYRLMGKEDEAAKAMALFQDAKRRQKAADDSEDMEWSFYAELYDPIEAHPAPADPSLSAEPAFADRKLDGAADAKTAGLMVIDADGDGKPDLLVWSRQGIRLYRNGTEPVKSGLEGITGVVSVAAGDFDNDELADLCVVTTNGAALYRNVKGRFEKKAAALPAGKFQKALWLDFDHDLDLDLFLLGEHSFLLRNENGAFSNYSGHFPFVAGQAIDAVAFRLVPDTKAIDLAVSYAGRGGVIYRDQLRGTFTAEPADAIPAGARSLHAADVDNDSWIDLAFAAGGKALLALNRDGKFEQRPAGAADTGGLVFADTENRGFSDLIAGNAVHRNLGLGKFAGPASPAGLPDAVAWATADFDGDGREDLAAVAADGAVHLLTNRTATKNEWLRVSLTGVKNLKLGSGAEVEIKSGEHYQKKIYHGVPLLFGLGRELQADTVRISWPNGLIQNQPKEQAQRAAVYQEAPRLSGSCPMVFAWNGREMQFISDVLGVAPLGASSGDGSYFPVDSDEYIQLPAGVPAPRGGRYDIRITEELHEVSYIDKVRLVAVDHPADTEIFTNDKFKAPPFPEFRLFGVKRRVYPVSARDGGGRDLLASVLRRDRVYAAGFAHDAAGRAAMHSLTLDFGRAARANRAVLILNGWIDWADGSAFMAASQGGGPGLVMPYVQVKDAAGRWRTVIDDMGVPSGGPKTIAVDLTGKFLSDSREVRIVTNTCLYWDEIFLSEDAAAPRVRIREAEPVEAGLTLRGFSRVVLDSKRVQPERYEYAAWRPEAMWDPIPGIYTRYGDVLPLTRAADDRYVIMGSGDELRLAFNASAFGAVPAGWKRDFLLLVDGWSKDGDANTAFSQSVEPLPFHGMSRYPYPASEKFPDDAAHRAWREQYNTRRALKLLPRLARRSQ